MVIFFRLDDELLETEAGQMSAVTRIQHIADDILIKESGKLVFLVELLDRLKVEGHRCLVFSQSRKMLDIMQKVVGNRVNYKFKQFDFKAQNLFINTVSFSTVTYTVLQVPRLSQK